MVRPKKSFQKKQKKGGIDFKKIRRKIGRKLPPPKNTTNTDIKSKAIILPEQSVTSEKDGLVVSNKGLTLRELLQQTSHYNPKIRRAALKGFRELCKEVPSELKLHKYAVIEKLRERITDEDRMVRETLYQIFKTDIFPSCKEDNQGPLILLVMACVFNAMTHLSIDIRLMAFKFLDLIVRHHPLSFSLYPEKILQNYENVLRNNQLHLEDKSKLKNIIAGLLHCLTLLPCKKREEDSCENDITSPSILHAFEPNDSNEYAGFSVIIKYLKDLIAVLVNCFHEFVMSVQATRQLDPQSFGCMLDILRSIDLAAGFYFYVIDNCHQEKLVLGETLSPELLKKLWNVFPLNSIPHLSAMGDDRYFILNIVITKIFLQLSAWNVPPAILLEKYIVFLESALSENIPGVIWFGKAHYEKYVILILPYLPKLVSQVESNWPCRLLQAFTKAFKGCKTGSSLQMACLSTIEEMLFPIEGVLSLDSNDREILDLKVSWIKEVPSLLIQMDDKHPLCSKTVLHLQLRLGQCAILNSEYDNMQYSLQDFYCSFPDEKTICYGPFMKLPIVSQELSICCLYYFSCLDSIFLKSLVSCCLSSDLQPFILLRIIEVLHVSYIAGHIQIGDHISFFITLLSRFKVYPDFFQPGSNDEKISNHGIFKSISSVIYSCLLQMGDNSLIFQILEKTSFDQISNRPPLDNICAMLRMLVELDSRLERISEQNITDLRSVLPAYLLDVAYRLPEVDDGSEISNCISTRRYYLMPCFIFLNQSQILLNLVLDAMVSLILESSPELLSCAHGQYASNQLSRINTIISSVLWMLKDVKLQHTLVSYKEKIERLLQNIVLVQSSGENNMTIQEKHRLQCAYDRLKIVTNTVFSGSCG